MKRMSTVLVLAGFFTLFQANVFAATLSGKALFTGTAPAAEAIKMDADPKCKMMHASGATTDSVIVNANGTLKNVLVYVKSGVTGKFTAPKDAVVLDQKGCAYSPKVFGIQTGQPIRIHNSDDTLHNVHTLSKDNPQFNVGMPIKDMKIEKKFAKAEPIFKIKCEVHPWMASYCGVFDHPFFAVTGDDGSFSIKDLPAGKYTVEAWHEKYGVQTQEITVAGDAGTADFTFKG